MLPHPEIGNAALCRQLFTCLEQLDDPVRIRRSTQFHQEIYTLQFLGLNQLLSYQPV